MHWKQVKNYLRERNRIGEISNEGKKDGIEIITTWNGWLINEGDPDQWINKIYLSGQPTKLVKIVLTDPPATKYDYWGKKEVPCGLILPPDKIHKEPRRILFEE